MSEEPDFEKELRLKEEDAANFLRELADSIEHDEPVALEGDGWKVFQPYQEIIPFRITQDEIGLEVDLKMLSPDED